MPRIKSITNPAWVQQRKLLMLTAAVSSNETILDRRCVTYSMGRVNHSHGKTIDPMTGKFVEPS